MACAGRGCGRTFTIGLHFQPDPFPDPAPFNARFNPQARIAYVNTLASPGDPCEAEPAVAKIRGSIQFECPACGQWTGQHHVAPDYETSALTCPYCQHVLYVTVTIYQSRIGDARVVPYDWAPPLHVSARPARVRLLSE